MREKKKEEAAPRRALTKVMKVAKSWRRRASKAGAADPPATDARASGLPACGLRLPKSVEKMS